MSTWEREWLKQCVCHGRNLETEAHNVTPSEPLDLQFGSAVTLAYDGRVAPKETPLLELTKDPIPKTLGLMALLTSLGMLALVGFGVADALFVGMLGEVPLAALTYAFPVLVGSSAVGVGLGIGAEAVLAPVVGRGDKTAIQRTATQLLVFATGLSIVLSAAMALMATPYPLWMGANHEVAPLVTLYINLWLLSTPPLIVALVGGGMARTIGDPQTPAIVMVICALLNIALDPLLIFGLDGWVPAYGFEGAAYATLATKVLAGVWCYGLFVRKYQLLSLDPQTFQNGWANLKEMLRLGTPAMGVQCMVPLGHSIILKLLSTAGTGVVAAFGLAVQIESLGLLGCAALNLSLGPFVGQHMGAQLYPRIREGFIWAQKVALVYTLSVATLMWLGGPKLWPMLHGSVEVTDALAIILFLQPFSFLPEGARMITSPFFNNTGTSLPPLVLLASQFFLVMLPLALLLSPSMGWTGIIMAWVIARWVISAVALLWLRAHLKTRGIFTT